VPDQAPPVSVCPWWGGRRWAYSITFDEALSDLHRFAVPILEAYGVPGHVEVVVGQMGEVRRVGTSSFNGLKHMGADELRDLIGRGWGVGNHSWSHGSVTAETAEVELGRAKDVLEAAIGRPVTIYCAPGSNVNMNEEALAGCRRYGYLGAMSITDALNRADAPELSARSSGSRSLQEGQGAADPAAAPDLLWLNRTFLHTQGYGPFYSEFDPFRNLQHARRDGGWIIDYLHCPLERAVHPNKDCSQAELRERIETVVVEGGDDVWLATVEAPCDYRYTRRYTQIVVVADGVYAVSAPGLPPQVQRRTVTLELPPGTRAVEVDGRPRPVYRKSGRPLLDIDLARPVQVRVFRAGFGREAS
jgi:peptidoglycan/xylan/chitin deacetylase (PgdA/CDA1 family)